jgi:integrase
VITMLPIQAARRVKELPPHDVTVGLWLTAWLMFFPSERSEETAAHDDAMLQPFIRRHGRKLLSAVTPLMAQQWAVAHPAQVRYLRRAWEKAVLMQFVQFNVWKVVEPPRRMKPTRGVLTMEQLDMALANARELRGWYLQFADLVEMAAFTGARLGGMCRMERSEVDLATRRVMLLEKGEKERTVVLTPRALEAAERALKRSKGRKLLFVSARRTRLDRHKITPAWHRIRGDIDLPFHSLKHFAGTWLASLGVDERDIAIQLGHTDSQGRPYVHLVRRIYVHPDHTAALDRIELATSERQAA